jgi:hypothetical protein
MGYSRWLPIASSGSKAADVVGFYRRRFDLLSSVCFAIVVGCSFLRADCSTV